MKHKGWIILALLYIGLAAAASEIYFVGYKAGVHAGIQLEMRYELNPGYLP